MAPVRERPRDGGAGVGVMTAVEPYVSTDRRCGIDQWATAQLVHAPAPDGAAERGAHNRLRRGVCWEELAEGRERNAGILHLVLAWQGRHRQREAAVGVGVSQRSVGDFDVPIFT